MTMEDNRKQQANESEKGSGRKEDKALNIILTELYRLSGREILKRILEVDNTRQLIQQVTPEDFFWLVKKIGEDDCLALLELASEEQWQYLLDLETWQKDRVNMVQSSRWLEKLGQAAPGRLVKWLFTDGQAFAYYYFFKSIEVVIREEDKVNDLGSGFFTLDGVFYIRVLDKDHREVAENILRSMASENFNRYQALVLGIAGVLPAEIEEEMYRLRNVRLAEHGFLPFEEAVSVYAPLNPNSVSIDNSTKGTDLSFDESSTISVPVLPLYHSGGQNILGTAISRISENALLDRIHLEFSGLCNQILSADGIVVNGLDDLVNTCRKAAGYLNVGLERFCGRDISLAERLVTTNSLVSIFRVGFGLALELKWEAERWLKKSWFYKKGLDFGFWGTEWGGTLAGLTKTKPLLYTAFAGGGEYREFELISELDACRKLIHCLMLLDNLIEQLTERYSLDEDIIEDSQLTFHPLLFNLWARQLLSLELNFKAISVEQAKELFLLLRRGDIRIPYRMPGFEEIFVGDFMSFTLGLEPKDQATLKNTLTLVWQEFCEEYERVSADDLDARFAKFIWLMPSPADVQ